MSKYELLPGKLIDTTMAKQPPQGMYNASNMTDEIAKQLIDNHPGYAKYFKKVDPLKVVAPAAMQVYPKYRPTLTCAVIIPTRGDRIKLLDHGLKLLNNQTVRPDDVIIIDHEPRGKRKDLTQRYRMGYDLAKKYDVVICWEDDDYYHPQYIETVMKLWEQNPGLELIGSTSTTYYHIFDKKYKFMLTPRHSSMMNTSIRGGLNIDWPSDDTVFLDLKLWAKMKGKMFDIGKLATGIKHGIGVCGGQGHNGNICDISDPDGAHLRGLVDPQSFEFYMNYDNGN